MPFHPSFVKKNAGKLLQLNILDWFLCSPTEVRDIHLSVHPSTHPQKNMYHTYLFGLYYDGWMLPETCASIHCKDLLRYLRFRFEELN